MNSSALDSAAPSAPGQRDDTVLVVDDNKLGRGVLCRILTTAGLRVEAACDGDEALTMMADTKFGVVLLDLQMPKVDGLEVLKRAREQWTAADLPILMISGTTDTEPIVEALDSGANDFLTRPIDRNILLAKIRRSLHPV